MTVEGRIEFQVVEQTPERVISEMPIQPGIKNPYGVVHAGAMLWLADVTATVLAMGSTEFSEGMSGSLLPYRSMRISPAIKERANSRLSLLL